MLQLSISFNIESYSMTLVSKSRMEALAQIANLVLLIYGAHQSLAGALPSAEHWLLERSLVTASPPCLQQLQRALETL